MLSVAVLVSGAGSNLRALLEAAAEPGFPARVVVVGADREAGGLSVAEEFGIPSFLVAHDTFDSREAWGAELDAQLRVWRPDLVVLSGLMRLLPPAVVAAWPARIVNTHPAHLPDFPGAHAVRDALAAGVTATGASVILVDDGVDTGPILAQERVPVLPGDDEHTLHERIKPVERRLLVDIVRQVADGTLDLAAVPPTAPPPGTGTPAPTTPSETRMPHTDATPTDRRVRDAVPVRRALVSVSDKTGLVPLAQALVAAGAEIVSTGSTARTIREAGLDVTDVETVTGFPESLDGRVKTLHPGVHAGLLADLRLADHEEQLAALGIRPFELVVSNLYPFAETVASGADAEAVVEQIDIGGPAMVRASAKNFANVAIVTSPESYPAVIEALGTGGTTLAQRRELAARAFAHTAAYDRAVATWFADDTLDAAPDGLPAHLTITAERVAVLRYGENSHQRAAIYARAGGHGIAQADQLQGKEMSYNNYVDADAALRAAFDLVRPAVAIIKHANPCGIATSSPNALDAIASAHLRAHECDPVSAFGGVIAANRTVTLKMAENLRDIFTEVIVAPDYEPEALEVFRLKKNLRVLRLPADWQQEPRDVRLVSGGLLLQDADRFTPDAEALTAEWRLVSGEQPDEATMGDLVFAWKACRAVKSNAIVLAKGTATVGIGMGQVNRVDSCRLAVERAGARVTGSVAASDAFFPFADGPQILIDAGVTAIVQPGGSVRDDEVVELARRAGVTMFFTGERHFFH